VRIKNDAIFDGSKYWSNGLSKKYKPKWRKSPFDHVWYCLVRNQEQMDRALESLGGGWQEPFKAIPCAALVTSYQVANERTYCILQIGDTSDWNPSAIMQTLVHETAHIWQRVRSAMREDQPSDEFEACSMEYIFQNMLDDYDRSQK